MNTADEHWGWADVPELLEALGHDPATCDELHQEAAKVLVHFQAADPTPKNALKNLRPKPVTVSLKRTKAGIGNLLGCVRLWTEELHMRLHYPGLGYARIGSSEYEIIGIDGMASV